MLLVIRCVPTYFNLFRIIRVFSQTKLKLSIVVHYWTIYWYKKFLFTIWKLYVLTMFTYEGKVKTSRPNFTAVKIRTSDCWVGTRTGVSITDTQV